MEPVTAAVLKWAGKKIAGWWVKTRPLSKEARETRQFKRDQNKTLKKQGLSRKERKMKLLEILAQFSANRRTSTKAGVVGLVPFVAMLPFYDTVNDYIVRACQSEEGPTLFLVGGAVVWATMLVTARLSKTPATPGAL
jgi:hypothetical protein